MLLPVVERYEVINGPVSYMDDGMAVRPYIVWDASENMYAPMVLVYNPHRNRYSHMNAHPYRHMRRLTTITDETRSICQTVFGAMSLAMLSASQYIEKHYPKDVIK